MTFDHRAATKDLEELRAAIGEMRDAVHTVALAVARKLEKNPSISAPAKERDHVIQVLEEIELNLIEIAGDIRGIKVDIMRLETRR